MKKILSTLYIILACATPAIAQVKVSISELVGTKWQISEVYERHESVYYEFTKEKFIWHCNDGTTVPYPFYLSNTIPEKFEYTKVGVSINGCYLNQEFDENRFCCYAILSFDKSKGIMVLDHKNVKFIGPDDPVTFILIKK